LTPPHCLPLLLLLTPLPAALPLPPTAAAPHHCRIAGATTTTKMSTSDINLVEHWFIRQCCEGLQGICKNSPKMLLMMSEYFYLDLLH
jgi:hypothetical protein